MSIPTINLSNCHHDRAPSRELLPCRGPIALATVFLLVFLLCTASAAAYTLEKRDEPVTEQFVISPTKTELTLQPGQSAVAEITVVNRWGFTVETTFDIVDFEGILDADDPLALVGDSSSAWGASRWSELELDSIQLEHGDTLIFNVRVTVPLDAEPGGHFAAVIATPRPADEADAGGVQLSPSKSSIILITVPGDLDTRATLHEPEVPMVAEFGPTEIGLVFNNLGNVHQSPSGTVTVTNILGQEVAELPVAEWIVLPESSRRTLVEWPGRWRLGPYKVQAQIAYGDEGELLLASSTVWFIPWKIIVAGLAAAFLILFVIAMINRRRRRKRQEVQDELEELRALKEGEEIEAGAAEWEEEEEWEEWEEEADEAAAEDESYIFEEEEYEELEGGTEAAAAAAGVAAAAELADEGEPGEEFEEDETTRPPFMSSDLVPLNKLLPSLEDTNLVDISDPETRHLIRELINNEMDLARMYMVDGRNEEARQELYEARSAALKLQLLAEVAMIDDLLQYL